MTAKSSSSHSALELPEHVVHAAYDAADAQLPTSAQGQWLRPMIEAALVAALDAVLEDDDAIRRARHAYLNSEPHGPAHNGPGRLAHMRAAVRAAFFEEHHDGH